MYCPELFLVVADCYEPNSLLDSKGLSPWSSFCINYHFSSFIDLVRLPWSWVIWGVPTLRSTRSCIGSKQYSVIWIFVLILPGLGESLYSFYQSNEIKVELGTMIEFHERYGITVEGLKAFNRYRSSRVSCLFLSCELYVLAHKTYKFVEVV